MCERNYVDIDGRLCDTCLQNKLSTMNECEICHKHAIVLKTIVSTHQLACQNCIRVSKQCKECNMYALLNKGEEFCVTCRNDLHGLVARHNSVCTLCNSTFFTANSNKTVCNDCTKVCDDCGNKYNSTSFEKDCPYCNESVCVHCGKLAFDLDDQGRCDACTESPIEFWDTHCMVCDATTFFSENLCEKCAMNASSIPTEDKSLVRIPPREGMAECPNCGEDMPRYEYLCVECLSVECLYDNKTEVLY